jgi:hypothetical protein
MRVGIGVSESETRGDVRGIWKKLGLKRADTFRWQYSRGAQEGKTQSSACVEFWGLLNLF